MSVPTGAGNYPAGTKDSDFNLPSVGDEHCPECGCDGKHLTAQDMKLLNAIYEYFDDTGDGAPDSSSLARQNLNFSEPMHNLIRRLK